MYMRGGRKRYIYLDREKDRESDGGERGGRDREGEKRRYQLGNKGYKHIQVFMYLD